MYLQSEQLGLNAFTWVWSAWSGDSLKGVWISNIKSRLSLQASPLCQWHLGCLGQPGPGIILGSRIWGWGDTGSPSQGHAPDREEVRSGHVWSPQQSGVRWGRGCRLSADGRDLPGSFYTPDTLGLRQISRKLVIMGLKPHSKMFCSPGTKQLPPTSRNGTSHGSAEPISQHGGQRSKKKSEHHVVSDFLLHKMLVQ